MTDNKALLDILRSKGALIARQELQMTAMIPAPQKPWAEDANGLINRADRLQKWWSEVSQYKTMRKVIRPCKKCKITPFARITIYQASISISLACLQCGCETKQHVAPLMTLLEWNEKQRPAWIRFWERACELFWKVAP